ncbi:MAG TPA: hypothetical protein VIU46_02015 [Gallionellaceae bacterium]
MKLLALISLTAILMLSACCVTQPTLPDADERGQLSTEMVNLSPAVETYFLDHPRTAAVSDAAILEAATQHDKSLLAPEFQHYLLKVQYQNPYAVVLLCSKDGKRAIMEDAGCSARLDRQVTHPAPCEFTLRVSNGCQVVGADPQ